jgi:putative heme-binding domain-containing protein
MRILCCLLVVLLLAPARAAAESGLVPLVRVLAETNDAEVQLDILRGMSDALRGRRSVKTPEGWAAVQRKLLASTNAEIRQKTLALAVLFGDLEALTPLRKTAADTKADAEARQTALQSLIEVRAPDLVPLLHELVKDVKVRGPALRGLAGYDDARTPVVILGQYAAFSDADKADAVNTLAARPAYALALLDAVEKGTVPRRDVPAYTARQMLNLKDKKLTERLTAVWGTIRATDKNKAALLAKYKAIVPPDALAKADRSHGRALFVKTCATCHMLFNEGGKIGPDLTGSQRSNPEYLLTKLLDPNAVVAKDFQVSLVETVNGRFITGIITKENDKTLSVQTPTELLTLPKADVAERKLTGQSLMPERQLEPLSDAEVRDLIAYLAGSGQVALPAGVAEPKK